MMPVEGLVDRSWLIPVSSTYFYALVAFSPAGMYVKEIGMVGIRPALARVALVALTVSGTLAGIHLAGAGSAPHTQAAPLVSVLTQHNDNARTGQNLGETQLTPAGVSVGTFGKLFTRQVDGQLYAQPLYVPDLTIPGSGTHNVVFVATMHNTVYAFDADDPAQSAPLWSVNLGPSVPVPDGCFGTGYGTYEDIQVEVGIVSTPVIDPATGTLYVVTTTKEGVSAPPACDPSVYKHHLHALDILTGAEKFGGPVAIAASASGTGVDASGGTITLNNMQHMQRPGLLLANGQVYLAFGSYGDTDYYHGWVLAYDAGTLAQTHVFIDTPDPGTDSNQTSPYEGGIWEGGEGLSVDGSGNIYFNTGNGGATAGAGGRDYGDSTVELSPSLGVVSYFTPYNVGTLNANDLDLASTGVLVVPGSSHVLAGGKQGIVYLMQQGALGGYSDGGNHVVQSFRASSGHIIGAPVYWAGPGAPMLYLWAANDYLNAFSFSSGLLNTTPVSHSPDLVPAGMTGGFLSLSANGNTAGSGIIWASRPLSGDANQTTVPGILEAYDAQDVSHLLWTSEQNEARDAVGNFAKFSSPTVANGKVYLGTFSNQLDVYGLLQSGGTSPTPTVTTTPSPTSTITPTASATGTPSPTRTPPTTPTGSQTVTPTATSTPSRTPTATATQTGSPATGLVGYWPMDEGTGATAADTSGSGNNAALASGVTWTQGRFGFALHFNGTTGYASAGAHNLPVTNASLSVSCWVNLSVLRRGSAPSMGVITLFNSQGGNLQMGISKGNFVIQSGGTAPLVSAVMPAASGWHDVVYTYDGSTQRLYIDGAQAATSTKRSPAITPARMELGRWPVSGSYLNGSLDDLRIYNRTLSAAEVLTLAGQP